ncbi:MAG: methyltransferase domain-containing protein [Anaerolineales bacterium]|nr:methyltransferase domain-containing protein [Anaerolineales bacterium]
MTRIVRIFSKLLSWLAARLPLPVFEGMLTRQIQQRAAALPADEALRFLFRLDAELYALQGPLAVKYNNGVHTKHRHTAYHDFFVERIKPGERVLDIGCGMGAVAFDIADRAGAIVHGVDLNVESIAEAQKRFVHKNLTFTVQDALQLEVDLPYDTVVLSNVLEHIHERPDFLRAAMQKTQAKRIFIRVPLFERDWRVPLKKELGVEWRLDLDHKTEYTLESFAEETLAAGLTLTHLEVHWGEVWAELAP